MLGIEYIDAAVGIGVALMRVPAAGQYCGRTTNSVPLGWR